MATGVTTITTALAQVVSPTITSATTYLFDTTALAAYQNLNVPATCSVIGELGIAATPHQRQQTLLCAQVQVVAKHAQVAAQMCPGS